MPSQKNSPYTQQDIAFVKSFFGTRRDLSFRLSWKHAAETAHYLKTVAQKTKEIDKALLQKLCRACLGHDLLEDTSASPSSIKKQWGGEVFAMIKEMTNEHGDTDFKDYITRLHKAHEGVLLIKLADIYSNVSHSVEKFERMDVSWLRTFWLPLLKKYQKELLLRNFILYPKTGAIIKKDIERHIALLKKKIKT